MPSTAIILVQPQMGENIGAAARAMHNFGLTDLRIVAPRDGWPNEAARSMAAHGVEVVDNATVCAMTREAVADLSFVAAATARSRELNKTAIPPEDVCADMQGMGGGKLGIMFGRESSGLASEDIAEADAILHIPTAPENPSLNIAQAVVVVSYELFKSQSGGDIVDIKQMDGGLAPKSDLHGLFDQLEAALDDAAYWREAGKKAKMWLNLRNLLTRAQMTAQEVRSMRGVVRALSSAGRK